MSDPDAAQLISGIGVAALVMVLAIVHRNDVVADSDGTIAVPDQPARTVTRGTVLRSEQVQYATMPTRQQHRSALAALVVGKDHRASTSKTVVFAWTLAIVWGLFALVVAVWLGDHGPWDAQVKRGLQEEYLLLLGGPIAAAVLAKYAAVSNQDAKTTAPVGASDPAQLVNDDSGDADLGDFQYVLFNGVGLAFFIGDAIGDLASGFPVLPPLLTGLMLTSTGGYAAKKLVSQAAPTLMSVIPASAPTGTAVSVFGTNLLVPASVADGGEALNALVYFGSISATVTAQDVVLGNDRLTVTVPALPVGQTTVTAVRADGAAASAPSGANALPFTVVAA